MEGFLFEKDEDYRVWLLLYHAQRAVCRLRQKELNRYGMSTPEAGVLFAIKANGKEATHTELSRWMSREPHSVFGLVERMEKKGFVTRNKDLDRKNLVRLAMTEKGRQAYSASIKRESIHRTFSCLSKKESRQLVSCLEKLRDRALQELGIENKPSFP